MTEPCEPFGPTYPDLGAGVAKFRRKAASAGSVKEMSREDRHAYADAIEKAIRAKHRTMHATEPADDSRLVYAATMEAKRSATLAPPPY